MLCAAERPLIVAGGGIYNAAAEALLVEFAETVDVPVIPTLMGWGSIPDDHPLMAGMCGLQTSHRYGNATLLESDFVLGIGNRWANRHTGSVETYTKGRTFVHVDIEPTQIGRVFAPDYGIVSDARAALELFVDVAKARKAEGRLPDRRARAADCPERKRTMLRKTNFDSVPMKPQRVYQCMNNAFGKDTCYVSTIGLSQIAAAQFLHVYQPRHWINCGQAGPLGWTIPAALGVVAADPARKVVALSGDYDFQFMIGNWPSVRSSLPYLHIPVNNAYLGLIRQSSAASTWITACSWASRTSMPTRAAWKATASITSRWSRAWLQGAARVQAGRPAPGHRAGPCPDGRTPRAGGDRGDPRSG